MKIYLLRHAVTADNELGIMGGSNDTPLSDAGCGQATEVVSELSKYHFDVCVVSPLQRTRQTIDPYLETLEAKPIVEVNELTLERDLGDLTNTSKEELALHKKQSGQDLISWTPPNGESFLDVEKRAKQFLNDTNLKHGDKSVLVCGHQNFLRCLELLLSKRSMDDFFSDNPPKLKNTELREFIV